MQTFANTLIPYRSIGTKKPGSAKRRNNPPLSHPVVRAQLSELESEALLKLLFAHATRTEFSIRWRWQENDVAFWDNRVTQHFAVDDYRPNRRVMHRATILGDAPF